MPIGVGSRAQLGDDVVFFMASKIKSNIRELEGALIRLIAFASLMGRRIECRGPMGVQKTEPRTGRTLAHGVFKARATVHACTAGCRWPSGAVVTRHAACLREALLPGSNVGYDVMVFVGLARFMRRRQREEIQALLGEQGIDVSTGEVSKLCREFVRYLGRLHRSHTMELKAVLESDGGWPLHVDATGEAYLTRSIQA